MLVPGKACGQVLRLAEPVSFWGGIDPGSGRVIATGHPQRGEVLAGRILVLERSIGSSSGSSVLLQLLASGLGPSGIILGEADLILTLGAVIAREMGYAKVPVIEWPTRDFGQLHGCVQISETGGLRAWPRDS